jgi:hypothetical protein
MRELKPERQIRNLHRNLQQAEKRESPPNRNLDKGVINHEIRNLQFI